MNTLPSTIICLLAVVAVALAPGEPGGSPTGGAADPELTDEARALAAQILLTVRPIEDTYQPQGSTQKRLEELVALTRRDGLQGAIIDWLMWPDRVGYLLVHDKQRVYLALQYWTRNTADLVDRGDLFRRLLAQTVTHPVPRRFDLLATIIKTLTESALSATDQDGRTPFEFYLELLCGNPELKFEIAVMLSERTPDAVLDRARDATVTRLPARVWARIFYRRNRALNVRDTLGMSSAVAHRLHTELILSRIRFAADHEVNGELGRIFSVMDPVRFISDTCRGVFDYRLDEHDLSAVWDLSCYYGSLRNMAARRAFLENVPYMFATLYASYDVITAYIDQLLLATTSRSWQSLVFRSLLSFHLKHHAAVGVLLADQYNESTKRLGLIRLLLLHRFKPDELRSGDAILEAGLRLGAGVVLGQPLLQRFKQNDASQFGPRLAIGPVPGQLDPVDAPINGLVLGLTLRTLFETNALGLLQTSGFLDLLPLLDADRLRTALMLTSAASDFGTVIVPRIQAKFPVLYERLVELLPDKMQPTVAKPAPSPIRTMDANSLRPIRVLNNIEDEYQIVDVLGAGMFGTVFRGYPVGSTREVAIKVQQTGSATGFAEAEFMQRFCFGLGAVPGLVRLYDAFRYGHDTFLVMERVHGLPMMSWPVPSDVVTATNHLRIIVYQMLAVLDRLYQAGWQHGDLQHLNNFLIHPKTGYLTLIDFGLCRPLVPGSASGLPSDQDQLYLRLIELMDAVRLRLKLAWWEPCPAPLCDLEAAIATWPYRAWTFAALMADPIFDEVRSISDMPSPSSSRSSPASFMRKARLSWASRVIQYCQRFT